MRFLPKRYWPLIGILLLVFVIGFFLLKARYEITEDLVIADLVAGEGLMLKNIHYVQNSPDEGVKWVLDAKEVRFSEDRQHISFNSFQLKLEPESRPSIELEGRRGDYNKNSGEINLHGDLRGSADNGYRIVTEHLLYRQQDSCLETDEPVKIIGPFFSVGGRGLHFDLEKEVLMIRSETTTLIEGESFLL